jgi:hypothetical protein
MSEINGDRILAPDPLDNVYGATCWTVVSTSAAAGQASAVKGAGAAGVKHVCYGISATAAAGAAAQGPLTVKVLDGSTSIFEGVVSAPANQSGQIVMTGLYLVGTAATSMTLQFTAGGAANTLQSCTLIGFDVT